MQHQVGTHVDNNLHVTHLSFRFYWLINTTTPNVRVTTNRLTGTNSSIFGHFNVLKLAVLINMTIIVYLYNTITSHLINTKYRKQIKMGVFSYTTIIN